MRGRIPALVPLKYERMLASPFGYFRGAVPVMAADLALLPNTGIVSQICGDAHVRNLGAYAAPDGRLVFDINDFDETTRAPFEWDLKRLAASLVLAGREAGAKDSFARMRCVHFLSDTEIRAHLRKTSDTGGRTLPSASPDEGGDAFERLDEGGTGDADTYTGDANGSCTENWVPHFPEDRPVLSRVSGALARQVLASMKEYGESLLPERRHILAQYRAIDVCFKVVGTGGGGYSRLLCLPGRQRTRRPVVFAD